MPEMPRTLRRPIAFWMFLSAFAGRGTETFAQPSAAAPAPEARAAREARAPIPLDGIAAIVGDVRIFRSDVTARARFFLDKLSKDPVKRRAELADLQKQVLMRLVDETLIAKDGAKLRIEVSDAEIKQGIDRVAETNKIDRKTLEAEIARVGLSLTEYHDEIRRQIFEGKWLVARVGSKIDRKLAASDPAAYQSALEKQREALLVDLRGRTYIEVR